MNWEILGTSLYVIGMIFLGLWFSKRIKNDDDYFLGGRSLGPVLATFSIFATWFGAETCIGTAGAVYRSGLSSIHADPLGYTICLLIMAIFFAKVLWRKKITTIPDLFRKRFSPSTEKLAALIMIPSSVIWAGAQIRAMGLIIHSMTDFGSGVAITVAACVVIIYTMCGGLLADAYADFIQGMAITVGLLFILCAVLYDSGGLGSVFSTLPPEKLTLGGGDFSGLSFLSKLELWMVPILGSLMSQELVSRVVASKSEKVAHRSALMAAVLYFFVGCIPVILGLIAAKNLPGLSDSETVMPVLAKMHLNYFFYILFVGALISAILSTVDTTLLASSALMSHNLLYPKFPNLTPKSRVLIARGGTLLAGVFSYFIAFSSESIIDLIETASSLGGPSILIITMIALWERRGDARNANFAIGMSIVVWAISHFVFEVGFPVLLTVSACALSYVISLPFTRAKLLEKDVGMSEMKLG